MNNYGTHFLGIVLVLYGNVRKKFSVLKWSRVDVR